MKGFIINFFIFLILIFIFTNQIALSCRCMRDSAKNNYCRSEWVSRVNVSNILTMYINDTKHPFYHSNQIIYIVNHIEVFKAPSRFNGTLPPYIYTPFESAACGLDLLSQGHEYLLSGYFTSHNIAATTLCGQILSDLSSSRGIIQEWMEVGDLQKAALHNKGYEPCLTRKIEDEPTPKNTNITSTTTTNPVPAPKEVKQNTTEKVIKN